MDKLDRLGWAAGWAFLAFGVRVGIRVSRDEPGLRARVEAALPPGWMPAASPVVDELYSMIVGGAGSRPGVRLKHVLYSEASRLVRTDDPVELTQILESDISLRVGAGSRERMFVHAGAVGVGGSGIV